MRHHQEKVIECVFESLGLRFEKFRYALDYNLGDYEADESRAEQQNALAEA